MQKDLAMKWSEEDSNLLDDLVTHLKHDREQSIDDGESDEYIAHVTQLLDRVEAFWEKCIAA